MVSNLSTFFSTLTSIQSTQDSTSLIQLLQSASTDPSIKSDLNTSTSSPSKDFTALVSNSISFRSNLDELTRDRFISLYNEFLIYVSKHESVHVLLNHNYRSDKGKAIQDPNQSLKLKGIYDSWASVYARAAGVFQQPETIWFIPVLRYLGTTLISIAIKIDSMDPTSRNSKITDAASRLSKSAGHAGNDRTQLPCRDTKRSAVMWLANASFRAYFKLNNVRLCETVLSSVENAIQVNRNLKNHQDLSGEEQFSLADRVTFKYYVGRLRLSQHRITAAFTALRWSFDNCTNENLRNKRRILIPLIASSLIKGIYPTSELLVTANLWDQYGPLIESLRKGHGSEFTRNLDLYRDWHRKNGTYLIMKEKLEVSVWRNLIRRTLLISKIIDQWNDESPPYLRLTSLLHTAKLSWGDESFEIEDMECIAISLIDQGYLRGYILHSKLLLVFAKGNEMGIPKISSVHIRNHLYPTPSALRIRHPLLRILSSS